MSTLALLQMSLAAKAQQTEGHLLHGNAVQEVLKSPNFLVGTLMPTFYKIEWQNTSSYEGSLQRVQQNKAVMMMTMTMINATNFQSLTTVLLSTVHPLKWKMPFLLTHIN